MNETFFALALGQPVADKLSGLTGTVIARTQWIYGCNRYVVQPDGLHDGKPRDTISFDENQLKIIGQPDPKLWDSPIEEPKVEVRPGGPRPEPQRRP